jgi:AraC family transcriptional regulator
MTDFTLPAPVIETWPDRRIMGSLKRYDQTTNANIPHQWAAYNQADRHVPGEVYGAWYGVCANFGPDMSFDYMCGMEVPTGDAPDDWTTLTLPAGRWAGFIVQAHLSTMQAAWGAIYRDHVGAGLTPRDGPSTEIYRDFDPDTGEGGYEIWVPVA